MLRRVILLSTSYSVDGSSGVLGNLLGMIIGRLYALAYASAAIGDASVRMTEPVAISICYECDQIFVDLPIDMKNPNVAPEPSMYCPNVLKGPCGPAPNLMILVAPKMKPMIKPTARGTLVQRIRADKLHSLPPISPPILTTLLSASTTAIFAFTTHVCLQSLGLGRPVAVV
jgi:hypothetical protein